MSFPLWALLRRLVIGFRAWIIQDDLIWRSLIIVYVLSHFSLIWLYAILWTVALQAPLSMRFSWQEYWSGLPCPPPGNLPSPGIELTSFTSPALAGGFFTTSTTWENSFFQINLCSQFWELAHGGTFWEPPLIPLQCQNLNADVSLRESCWALDRDFFPGHSSGKEGNAQSRRVIWVTQADRSLAVSAPKF